MQLIETAHDATFYGATKPNSVSANKNNLKLMGLLEQSSAFFKASQVTDGPGNRPAVYVTTFVWPLMSGNTEDGRPWKMEQATRHYWLLTDYKGEDVRPILEHITAISPPATQSEILKGLAGIWVTCKERKRSAIDMQLMMEVMSVALATYPADAVATAIQMWPLENEFTPTQAELISEIKRITNHRRTIIAAIKNNPPKE